jgi:hypothetical protein
MKRIHPASLRPLLYPFALVGAALISLAPVAAAKQVDAKYEAEMNPLYRSVKLNTQPDLSGHPAKPAGFVHPGVLVNRAQLEEIKRRVAAGVEPQKTAYEKLKDSKWGARGYTPHPVPKVVAGPYSNPDIGARAEQADSEAAYGQALLWVITGDRVYAQNAIKIMDAWSGMLKGGHVYGNGPIQSAWCSSLFSRAAEIMRYTGADWSDAQVAQFQNFLRTQYLPSVMHGDRENGNKELAMCEALINMGVFLDDRSVFNLGVRIWRGRVPAYIYLKSDGPKPIEPPGAGEATWGNKDFMPKLVDGIMQETARDSHHPWLAFSSLVDAAETARQQGLDLYAEQAKRITAALEYEAQYLPPNHEKIPAGLTFDAQPTYEIAYNHFHNRLGQALPKIAAVLPTIRPTGVELHMTWETLTHGEMGDIGLPPLKPRP